MSCVTTDSTLNISTNVMHQNISCRSHEQQKVRCEMESKDSHGKSDYRKTFAKMRGRQKRTNDENQSSPDSLPVNNEGNGSSSNVSSSIGMLGDITASDSNYSFLSEMVMSTADDLKPEVLLDEHETGSDFNNVNPDFVPDIRTSENRMNAFGDAGVHLSELSLLSGLSLRTGDISAPLPTWCEGISSDQTSDNAFNEENKIGQGRTDTFDEREEVPIRGLSMVRMEATRKF
jgi:hypothetical protein